MADFDYSSLIGPAVQAGSNLAGNSIAASKDAEAEALYKQALARYLNLPTPSAAETTLDHSQAGSTTADPSLVAAQRDALAKMGQVERDGGLTLEDKGALSNIYNRLGQQESAQRASIQNSMAARGTGGSGAELAMALEGNAQAQKSRAQATQSIAAQAQKRYLDSIMARGEMATKMNGQDFNQRFQAGTAEDSRLHFNAEVPWKRGTYDMQKVAGAAGQNPGFASVLDKHGTTARDEAAGYGVAGNEFFKNKKWGTDPSLTPVDKSSSYPAAANAADDAFEEDA